MDNLRKLRSRLFVGQMWKEALVSLLENANVIVGRQILKLGVNHQSEDVQQVVTMVAQLKKRVDGFVLEVFVAFRVLATHAKDHGTVEANRRVLFLAWRVFAEDEAEV
jgi:hypothetical protein